MKGQGFTLVEALVALAVIAIALSFVLPVFLANLNLNTQSDAKTQAAAIAQRILDSYRLRDPGSTDIPTSGTKDDSLTDQNGDTWQYTASFCTVPNYCGPGSRHIRVDVKQNGNTIYSAETVYTQLFYETESTK